MCLGAIGKVTSRWDEAELPMATVEYPSREETVCLAYVPETKVGDLVLVHIGFAVEVLEPQDAAVALELRSLTKETERMESWM